ncbi:acyl carrier protein [Methylocystis echinoides]|uniref:Carrier domain-containing protein n=1 Tax=Methylocystis echinoides TaxID=29468 RepID=A0A9W6GT56_9HYPH|nr:phosphopantetheine-binding protein [Methylocystis echinoides]GLI92578.1 hypothetical protein LMG27198_15700 [Methylocystis echinoides]
MTVSLAANHRVTDGHLGRLYLAEIARFFSGAPKIVTDDGIRSLPLQLISDIAPEADPTSIADDEDIREAFDLDSMDFANLVVAIHKRTGVNIPELDHRKLFTLGGAIAHVEKALGQSGYGG